MKRWNDVIFGPPARGIPMKRFEFALGLVCTLVISSAAHAATLRTVALGGQQAPGAPDGVLFDPDLIYGGVTPSTRIALNDAGQTAFRAALTGNGVTPGVNSIGIWSERSGSLALVVRSGDPAPGTPETFASNNLGYYLVLNDAGQTVFYTTYTNGIWSDRSGSLAPVVRVGDPVPGLLSGDKFTFISASLQLALNNAGQTAFWAGFGDAGVSTGNGIWSESSGSLTLVARAGEQAAGMPRGVNFSSFITGSTQLGLNDAGQVAFYATLTGTAVDSTNNQGIWTDRSGSLAPVVRTGEHAPGTPSGVNFRTIRAARSPALNNTGLTAFAATLTGSGVDSSNDVGVWSEGSGNLALAARAGEHAPGTPSGVTFKGSSTLPFTFSDPVLNDAGQAAFNAYLTGSGVDLTNDAGIWLDDAGTLKLVAREGDRAPGTPDGVNFTAFGPSVLNEDGQIAFMAGTIADYFYNGIWATDRRGALQLIARSGDLLEVAPGDFRTIAGFSFYETDTLNTPTGNSDGRRSGFNNLGQLAFYARFTDETAGMFVSNRVAIPEPSTILLLAFAAGTTLVIRARVPRSRLFLRAGLVLFLATAPAIAHAATLRTVALSGQPAPGTRGEHPSLHTPNGSCSRKELAQFGERLAEFRLRQTGSRIEDHRLFDGEQAIRPDVTADTKLAALEFAGVHRDRVRVAVRLAGDLAQDQVIARQIDNDQRRPTLAQLQVGLRKRQNHYLAGYRFAHAASSSGVLQSRSRTDSLANSPLNASLPDFSRKKRAKS
jgi:hypothetical protein